MLGIKGSIVGCHSNAAEVSDVGSQSNAAEVSDNQFSIFITSWRN